MPKVTPKAVPRGRTYLRAWREHTKLSQEKAAKRLGIDRSHLSKLETGNAQYNQGFMEAAAKLYGCTIPDLLLRNPKDKTPLSSLINELERADQGTRDTATDVLRVLLKKVS